MTTAKSNSPEVDLFGPAPQTDGANVKAAKAKKPEPKQPKPEPSASAPVAASGGLDNSHADDKLPSVPDKRYFTISEASRLCAVKPHVLRYWESEFEQLSPVKRAGNRRYYQRQDIFLIRTIRDLLHEQGFTISGAKQKLLDGDASQELSPTKQLLHNLRSELEELLKTLKK